MQAPDGEFARRWSTLPADGKPLLIVHVDRERLFLDDPTVDDAWRQVVPDVVVFDESFVDRGVPFGAFAAGPQLFGRWNRRGMATFHSTTYQPNTISTLHFMNCLRRARPDFVARHADQLERLEHDPEFLLAEFRQRYSPSLGKLIKAAGFDRGPIRAVGHYIEHGERKLFDAVAGVACSVRGHNPESYAAELESMDGLDRCRHEIARRLRTLTGLSHFSPAVSGASAVEQALKLGLLAQFPRSHVLALQGGFGGKTLFALTGTAKPSLKRGLDPLYPHVVYVDPFSPRAGEQIEDVCRHLPVGVVQFELVQGVGGVRAVPPNVLQCLVRMRERHGCLLFVDEVQTGVYRTGPFARSAELGLRPDLLTVGKGTSDMMFPFALTLYSAEVRRRLEARDCGLPQLLDERYGYELGYRTVLNTLRRADEQDLEARVRRAGERLAEALAAALRSCRAVRDVRCFGLLVGVELDVSRFPRRLFRRLIPRLSLLAMMQHREFPLVAGFCQYEPNVLKLTPPLSIDDDEIQSVAATLAAVLRMSPMRLASSALLNRRRPTSC
jgi:acetylornithine/succinyldiaminopimelate/putrescine aminotransferase